MQQHTNAPYHLGSGEAQGGLLWFLGNLVAIKAGSGGEGSIAVIEAELHPGHAPPLHVHHHEDEGFILLAGDVRFRCGDDEFDARAGDFVFVPRGTPHAFRVGAGGARTIMVASGAALAAFMQEIGEPAREPVVPGTHDVPRERLAEVAARHDMTVVGPPLPA